MGVISSLVVTLMRTDTKNTIGAQRRTSHARYGLRRAIGAFLLHVIRVPLIAVRSLLRRRTIYVGRGTKIAWDVTCSREGEVVLGEGAYIGSGTSFRCGVGGRIEVGDHTRIGENCYLQAMPGQTLTIGKYSGVADCVRITSVDGIELGDSAQIGHHVEIGPQEPTARGSLKTGERVYISAYSNLDLSADIVIDDDVAISPFCSFYTHSHTAIDGTLIWDNKIRTAPIRVGRGAWIGHGASLMPGVQIGANSVVGALAVVTRPVEVNVLVGGVPAKVIRRNSTVLASKSKQKQHSTKPADGQ
jgi:maltose O-acetyltransferase